MGSRVPLSECVYIGLHKASGHDLESILPVVAENGYLKDIVKLLLSWVSSCCRRPVGFSTMSARPVIVYVSTLNTTSVSFGAEQTTLISTTVAFP